MKKISILFSIIFLIKNLSFAQSTNSTMMLSYKENDSVVKKSSSFYVQTLSTLKATIKNTEASRIGLLDTLNKQMDSIRNRNVSELLTSLKTPKTFSIFNIGMYEITELNKYFYDQKTSFDILQTVSVQSISKSNTLINAEFGSFLFGIVKMGLSGSFTTTGDTTKDEAVKTSLQKIISNGGAMNFSFLSPLFFWRARTEQAHCGIFGQLNFAINPEINDSTGETDFSSNSILFSNASGFIFHFDVTSNDNRAKLSIEFPYYYVWGSNKTYEQQSSKDYSILKLQIALVINNLINLHISGPLISKDDIQKIPFTLGLGFSPSSIFKSGK